MLCVGCTSFFLMDYSLNKVIFSKRKKKTNMVYLMHTSKSHVNIAIKHNLPYMVV